MQTIDKQTVLFAQPYDISAEGFYFASVEQYQEHAASNRNSLGLPVEEYEIQFIDGDLLDAELFKAVGVSQANFGVFIDACNYWDTDQKRKAIIAVGECGYSFDLKTGDPDEFDVDIYEMNSLRDLARDFVDEGIYGELPEWVKWHLDYDSVAHDLGMDYTEAVIAGTPLIYRCG